MSLPVVYFVADGESCRGTPTSTTTSLSALSTIAIKDGHHGHHHHPGPGARGHQQNHSVASTSSLEAERADRISRLPGFSAVQTQRTPPSSSHPNARSPQTTPTSSGFHVAVTAATAPGGLTPAYFDAAGQPVAQTKMSTVGTASATESLGALTTTEAAGDHDMLEPDEDMLSTDTFSRAENDSVGGEADAIDEDMANRSVGAFEDRMSDDGNASLVGFGEGAGSTVSGPIYHRRPLPAGSSASAMERVVWGLERSSSGLSESAQPGPSARRDTVRGTEPVLVATTGLPRDGETSTNQPMAQERKNSRTLDRGMLSPKTGLIFKSLRGNIC